MGRELDTFKIGVVFVASTLLFVSGFLFSDYLTNIKVSTLGSAISDVALQTTSLETEYQFLLQNTCSSAGFNKLTASLDELGHKLVFTDDEKVSQGSNIESLKANYFLLEIKHLLFVKNRNTQCDTNYTTIMYFYSDKLDCELCKAQGPVLTNAKQEDPNVMIYSFDFNSKFPLVSTLKEVYQVKSVPAVVINDKLYEGLQDQNTVLELIKKADELRQQQVQSQTQ